MRNFGKKLASIALALVTVTVLTGSAAASAYSATETQPAQSVSWKSSTIEESVPFEELEIAENQKVLPEHVYLRDPSSGSYNAYYELCLYDGIVYVKHRDSSEKWRVAPMPAELKGQAKQISADGNNMVILDKYGWIYSCHGLLSDTDTWTWQTAWGGLLETAVGYRLPQTDSKLWSLSVLDPDFDQTYTDSAGEVHVSGGSGCTDIYYVDTEDPTNIIYLDPWLPNDEAHIFSTPINGRFKIQSMSASASTLFIINKYGDMYTRLYDYDCAGGDEVFFNYTWYGLDFTTFNDELDEKLQELGVPMKNITLPSNYWVKVDKIPGTITDRISIESTAAGSENRLLKVEGKKDGKTGYWSKPINGGEWTFTVTGEKLQGTILENSSEDTSEKDLAPASGIDYSGTITGIGATLTVTDFCYSDTRQTATLTVGDVTVPVTLYNEYGNLGSITTMYLTEQPKGLSSTPRRYTCALELSDSAYNKLNKTVKGKIFLTTFFLGQKIRPLSMKATTESLAFSENRQILDTPFAAFTLYRTDK